jgi:hypothetical protein
LELLFILSHQVSSSFSFIPSYFSFSSHREEGGSAKPTPVNFPFLFWFTQVDDETVRGLMLCVNSWAKLAAGRSKFLDSSATCHKWSFIGMWFGWSYKLSPCEETDLFGS